VQRNRHGFACLLLPDVDRAAPDVLASHADDVAPALRGVEQQCKREPRFRADRMAGFVRSYLLLSPCMKSGRMMVDWLQARSGVVGPHAFLYCESHHGLDQS
jgi:hypothetical protein